MLRTGVACIILLSTTIAIPIDNGVQGEPEISCDPSSITLAVATRNSFEGHVYVRGRFAEPGCSMPGDGARATGDLTLPFDTCGVLRERSLNPRGVFVSVDVVVSFHPKFLTKVDRAYTIQCFYMEADKTVSTDIEVSEITTALQTALVPMPICRYEILDAPAGQVVDFAIIGQAVFHKWTCDSDAVDTFCMFVHSCVVSDGANDTIQVLDANGCAIDKYLLGNVEYPTDLMGLKEVHVFKFADRAQLEFNCQISISIKEPAGQCPRPTCQEPGGEGDGARARRQVALDVGTIDVHGRMSSLDIDENGSTAPRSTLHLMTPAVTLTADTGMCLPSSTFYIVVILAFVLVTALSGAVAYIAMTRRDSNNLKY